MPSNLKEIAQLTGHTDRVWHLSWSPSTPTLASCSSDKSLRLYTYTPSRSFTHQSTIPTSHARTVRSLSFSPTGATLATASFDSTVGIWTQVDEAGIEEGEPGGAGGGEWEPVDPLEGHESECKGVEWSADGRLLASCSRDKSVWVWEATGPTEFECLAVLMEHTQDVKAVTWHPTSELLASASYDDTIKLYSADPYDDEWTCTHTLTSHTATVWTISFSPCGEYLVSAGDDLVLKIWGRIRLGGPSRVLEGEGEAKREEGGRMGPWSRGGVRIGEKEKWSWELVGEIKGAHERTIYSVDWKRGGLDTEKGGLGRVVTAGGDGVINVFQMTKPTPPSLCPTHTLLAAVESAHGVSDVNHVAWCTLSPSKAAQTLRRLEGGEADPEDVEMEETEPAKEEEDSRWKDCVNMFASAGDDGVVRVWYLEHEEEGKSL